MSERDDLVYVLEGNASQAPLTLVTRDDGGKQYAWKGKPLYYYAEDKKPGDTTGHEVGKSWFVVAP
jgi:predicted lipoprotein with Yx(FWY)xxD motif